MKSPTKAELAELAMEVAMAKTRVEFAGRSMPYNTAHRDWAVFRQVANRAFEATVALFDAGHSLGTLVVDLRDPMNPKFDVDLAE